MNTGPLIRSMAACAIAVASLFTGGCVTAYVDGALKDTDPSQIRPAARPQDAQLLFTFQTKGTANAKATELLKSQVTELVSSSGLFAAVGPDPALSGAVISLTLNNVLLTDQNDAYAKGFVTGLTFGLAGSAVSDGYVCTIDYLPPGGGSRITTSTRHAIHSTVGAKGAPQNAIKAKNVEDGVRTMTRQIVTEALKELSQEPVFQ